MVFTRRWWSAAGIALLAGAIPMAAETPNTGMADPAALINAFDQFLATVPANGGSNSLSIPLTAMRGITSGGFNAGGSVRVDLGTGLVSAQVRGLPADGSFDLW